MLTLSILAAGLGGCATIIHGTTQKVRFESTPAGAMASAGSQSVTTPGEIKLARDQTYEVKVEKSGYVPAHAHIGQTTSNAVWANILLGGIIGMLVDYDDGAAYDLEPATVSTTLIADPAVETPVGKNGTVTHTNASPIALIEMDLTGPALSVEQSHALDAHKDARK